MQEIIDHEIISIVIEYSMPHTIIEIQVETLIYDDDEMILLIILCDVMQLILKIDNDLVLSDSMFHLDDYCINYLCN